MNITQIIGLLGALIAVVGYIPQVSHLIEEKCSVGISKKAYILWLIASGAMLTNAISIKSIVFIFLSTMQIVATSLILYFSYKYKVCAFHAQQK